MQLVQRVADDCLWVSTLAMVLLQCYMCTKFSVPVKDSRQKFMLVYQAQPSLLQSVETTREEHAEEQAEIERHQRYQMAAIKDADLLIKLWSALTYDGVSGAGEISSSQYLESQGVSPLASPTECHTA